MCRVKHFPVGQGGDENPRAGKNNKNQLNQKFGKSAFIVIGKFVMHFGILIKEKITSSKFKKKSVYKEDSQKVKSVCHHFSKKGKMTSQPYLSPACQSPWIS